MFAYRGKRRDLSLREVIRPRENACPYIVTLNQQKLGQFGRKTLEHAPFSPCDFHNSGSLEEALGGQKFHDDVKVDAYACNCLQTRPISLYEEETLFTGEKMFRKSLNM